MLRKYCVVIFTMRS